VARLAGKPGLPAALFASLRFATPGEQRGAGWPAGTGKRQNRALSTGLRFLLAAFLAAWLFTGMNAQDAQVVVRAYYTDPWMVAGLSSWTEPWEVNRQGKYVVLGVDTEGIQRLEQLGFRVEVDPALTQGMNRPAARLRGQTSGIPGFPCYRTVEETYAAAQALAAAHPDLAEWSDIGDSWEKATPGGDAPGYDLMALRLTNTAIPGPKPVLFAMAAIHAREYATAELLARFAETLVNGYGSDADVTWLLDYHEIHLLLQANPDGRKNAEQASTWWRKNTDRSYCAYSSPGADLNRNFPFQWSCCNGSSSYECDDTYRGLHAASEPETQAMRDYLLAHFADQRDAALDAPAPDTASGLFLDIHSYGDLVLWPWGFTYNESPNAGALQTLGRKLAYFNGYWPEQAVGLYPTDGTTDDFAYGELGVAAYTFEMGTQFHEDCAAFEQAILPANLDALLYAARTAAAPYRLPSGPDAYSLAAQRSGIQAAQKLIISATIDDTRYSSRNGFQAAQNIAAAQVFLDAPPWITTTLPIPQTMTAADGAFDEAIENVSASIDAPALSEGRHIAFVRGQDTDGNWGPVTALFVDVLLYDNALFFPLVMR
jgi:carboxypeptidase T